MPGPLPARVDRPRGHFVAEASKRTRAGRCGVLGAIAILVSLALPSPSVAAITWIQSVVKVATSNGTSITSPAVPQAIQAGDLIVVGWRLPQGTISVTDNQGQTYTQAFVGGTTVNNGAYYFANSVAVAANTLTVTASCTSSCTAGKVRITVDVFRGAATSNVLATSIGISTASQSTSCTVQGTTSSVGAGLLVYMNEGTGTNSLTFTACTTNGVAMTIGAQGTDPNQGSIYSSYALSSAAGAQNPAIQASSSAAAALNGGVAVFNPLIADPSYVAADAQSGQVTVYWSSANPVVVLRKTSAFAGEAPANGTTYSAGNTIGAATVAYVGSATSFTDSVANGTYYYKVFAYTAGPNYSPGTVNTSAGVNANPAASPPAWSYTLAGGSMLSAAIAGTGTIYTSSNANWILSLNTATGTQSWSPAATTAAVQGWLTWLPVNNWYPTSGWSYRKAITIHHSQVAAALTSFPVLVSITDAGLQTYAQASGNDILFTAADGQTKLNHEIERYTSSTGQLIAWVQVPSLSTTADTVIFMYYGNASAPNQQNVTATWDANYEGVWHLNQSGNGTAGEFTDSTSEANNGTGGGGSSSNTPAQATGEIGYGQSFNGTSQYIQVANSASLVFSPSFTASAWIYPTAWGSSANQYIKNIFGNEKTSAPASGTFIFRLGSQGSSTYQQRLAVSIDYGTTPPYSNTDLQSTANLSLNTWQYGTVTYDGSNVRFYINGSLDSTTAFSQTPGSPGNNWFIGTNATPERYFAGTIDEVRVSATARPAGWIQTEYNNQSSPATFYSVGAAQASTGGTVIGGDQGANVYAVDTTAGAQNWGTVTLTGVNAVQAAAAAQLRAWSNSTFQSTYTGDVLFLASRNTSSTNNTVYALKAADGSVLWNFNPSGTTYNIDYIVGQPLVDYGRNRLYVASRAGSAGTQSSLWVINSLNGSLIQQLALSHLQTSPTLSYDGNTIWVAGVNNAGTAWTLYAIDTTTFAQRWSYALTGALNGFVWEDPSIRNRLYFSTADGNAWSLTDSGGSTVTQNWKTSVGTSASNGIPLDAYYVASSDGTIHMLNFTTGASQDQFPKTGTLDGTNTLGDLSTETGNELFVGTSGGKLFKIPLPLP